MTRCTRHPIQRSSADAALIHLQGKETMFPYLEDAPMAAPPSLRWCIPVGMAASTLESWIRMGP